MSDSIFSKIIDREIPGQFVYEDDVCAVFMDKFPTVKGQSLVVSKKETDYMFALDDATYTHLFAVAKKIATASDKALATDRTCLVVEGFDVPHVHIKLYPMQIGDRPLGQRLAMGEEASDEELAKVAAQIQAALAE